MGFALYPGRLMALASGRSRVVPYDHAVRARSDLLAFHWDNNVPWHLLAACGSNLDSCTPPKRLRKAHTRLRAFFDDARATTTAQGGVRYVAISPLDLARKGVSVSFESQQGVRRTAAPATGFADPALRGLYLDFVRYAMTKFDPAYFSPGIEINMYAREQPADFANLLSLMAEARALVRTIDPTIVTAPSIQWEFYTRDWHDPSVGPVLRQLAGAMPEIADGVFFSTYPNIFGEAGKVSTDAYSFGDFGLRVEPGTALLVSEAGTQPALQAELIGALIGLGERYDVRGIVWFLVQDMDRLDIPVPGLRDIGLFDDSTRALRPHPGAAVWDGYFACPVTAR